MANLAAFTFLLMYLYSAQHGLLSLGHLGSTGTPSSSYSSRLIQLSEDQPLLPTACWHTQNQTTASPAYAHRFRQHVRFKLSVTMPMTAFLDLSPTRAMAKSGQLTTSGRSAATSVTSFSTNNGEDILQDYYALLATLQERKIHAPPGPRPACAGACGATTTQLHAKHKAAKDTKAKVVKDKKLLLQLVRLRSSGKKVAPHLLCQGQGGQGSFQGRQTMHQTDRGHQSRHLPYSSRVWHGSCCVHFLSFSQKEQRDADAPSPVPTPAAGPQLSLQLKMMTANKRVSIQSPLRFPLRSSKDLSISGSSTSSPGEDEVPLVGLDTDNKIETLFVVLTKHCDFLLQSNCLEARGGCRYGSPLARGCVGLKPAGWPVTGQARAMQRHKPDDSLLSSNGSWMEDDSNVKGDTKEIYSTNNNGNECCATAFHKALTPVCPTTLFSNNRNSVSCQMERNKASILDGIWLGSHDITLLTCFVACHFAGYWTSYLPFATWADTQSLENPSSTIQLDDWLSLKSDGGDSSAPLSFLDAEHALDCRPAVETKGLDGNILGHKLCNKTDVDSVQSPQLIGGPGTIATATTRCTSHTKNPWLRLCLAILIFALCSRQCAHLRLPRLLLCR
jgi:hypothetical protein